MEEKLNRLTVFEAINRKRKEIFIGSTPQPMHAAIADFRASPPPGTAFWKPEDVEFRSLAFDVAADKARAVIRLYAAAHPDWKVLTEPEERGR